MSDEGQPTIVLYVPSPPSANRIWRKVPNSKRPILSAEYREWIATAGWTARTQLVGVPTILGSFNAVIIVPEKSRRDRDNWSKPLFDLCQRIGAVRNDRGLKSYRVDADTREDCMIALWDLGGPPLPEPKVRARKKTASSANKRIIKKVSPADHARVTRARMGWT